MINILVIEDEIPARKKLNRLLGELDDDIRVVAEIDTVEMAIRFLNSTSVDLIFSDIELLDGNAFEIYRQVSVSCPIIFTTAYDQFWMDAFESNGIAYLLKPFSRERFHRAWDKFTLFRGTLSSEHHQLANLAKLMEQNLKMVSFKKRFVVHRRQGIYFLGVENVTLFEASSGVIYAFDMVGEVHVLSELTLREIVEKLDPNDFFQINRSQVVHKLYIEKIERYTKNTLAVKITGRNDLLKTSQSNTARFREWIER